MGLFDDLRQIIDDVVDFAGDATKVTINVVTTVATEVVATPLEVVAGNNALSNGLRDLQQGVSSVTDNIVDDALKPVARAMGKAPIRKVERVTDIAGGLGEFVFEGNPEGLERAGKAALEIGAIVATGAILGAVLEHADTVSEMIDSDALVDSTDADISSIGDYTDGLRTAHNHALHFGSDAEEPAIYTPSNETTVFGDGTQVTYALQDSAGNSYPTRDDFMKGTNASPTVIVEPESPPISPSPST